MLTDNRLLSAELLALAALRCKHREERAGWQDTEGLAALLDHAKKYPAPPRDWLEFDARDPQTLSGMEKLLWEARREQREGR